MGGKSLPEKKALQIRIWEHEKRAIDHAASELGTSLTDLILYAAMNQIQLGINRKSMMRFLANRKFKEHGQEEEASSHQRVGDAMNSEPKEISIPSPIADPIEREALDYIVRHIVGYPYEITEKTLVDAKAHLMAVENGDRMLADNMERIRKEQDKKISGEMGKALKESKTLGDSIRNHLEQDNQDSAA